MIRTCRIDADCDRVNSASRQSDMDKQQPPQVKIKQEALSALVALVFGSVGGMRKVGLVICAEERRWCCREGTTPSGMTRGHFVQGAEGRFQEFLMDKWTSEGYYRYGKMSISWAASLHDTRPGTQMVVSVF